MAILWFYQYGLIPQALRGKGKKLNDEVQIRVI